MHAKQEASLRGLAHGRVTGPVPRGKMLEFLREGRCADDRALRKNVDEERVRRGEAPRLRKGKKLFARYRLWFEAAKLGSEDRRVHDLTDLIVEELHRCVVNVHEHFRKHPRLQARAGAKTMGFVKPGQGPAARADLADPGFAYNGEGGGRVFSWYRKGLFGWFLNQLGYAGRDLSKCSERQCMDALLATSEKLRLFPMETAELQPFAGPQCYPHLSEKARLDANSKKPAKSGEAASPDIVRARQQLQDCWLKCHGCGSWRLVDRCSFPALDPEAFAADLENQEDVKWRIYFDGTAWRNKLFLQRRRQQERAMRPSDADEGLESDADSDEAPAAASLEPAPL